MRAVARPAGFATDEVLPDHVQVRSRTIDAGPECVWAALAAVTGNDLLLTRLLMAVRHLGRPMPQASAPVLTHGPVDIYEITEPTHAVGGAIMRTWQLHPDRHQVRSLHEFHSFTEPGWVKVLAHFSTDSLGQRTKLTATTQVWSTDARTRRRFALYWTLIAPFAALVRDDILRTTAVNAEVGRAPG